MNKPSESEFQSCVEKAGSLVQFHNERHPSYPLKELSPSDKSVVLLETDEFKEVNRDRDAVAVCVMPDEMIYVNADALEEESDKWKRLSFCAALSTRERMELTLLDILSHENTHRSCKRVFQPPEITSTYQGFLEYLYKGLELPDLLETIKGNRRAMADGMAVIFENSEEYFHPYTDHESNELVNSLLSAITLARYLEHTGSAKDYRQPLAGSIINRSVFGSEEAPKVFRSIITHEGSERLDAFFADYINGGIPGKILENAEGYMTEEEEQNILTNLLGHPEYLPGILKLYGLEEQKA